MISFFMFRDLTIKVSNIVFHIKVSKLLCCILRFQNFRVVYKGFKTFVFGFQKPKTNAACQNVFLD